MSKEKCLEKARLIMKSHCDSFPYEECVKSGVDCRKCQAAALYDSGWREDVWISVDERLPSESEFLTYHKDGLSTLKRLVIAYKTDTIEYDIGCYDGHKWMNQLGNRIIKDVVAWKSFELYLPKAEGGE